MLVKSLELKNFRNYQTQSFTFDPYLNIIIGDNAQGKTNILESLYLISTSKSFRTGVLEEMIHFDEMFAKINASVESNHKDLSMDMILSKQGKKAMINHKDITRMSDYLGYFNVILFLPDDLLLIKGSPKLRRNLIDKELSKISPIYMYSFNKYMSLLKERNAYLKRLKELKKEPDDYLDILTLQLIDVMYDLIQRRESFIQLLDEISHSIYHYISFEDLHISYKCRFIHMSKDDIYDHYKKYYKRDIQYSHTSDGIHKDDMVMTLNKKDASLYASQGQQRSIILSMKMSLLEIGKKEIGEYPVLLLDDVLSELDSQRIEKLLKLIDHKVQTFITTTGVNELSDDWIKKAKVFSIENGAVKEDM